MIVIARLGVFIKARMEVRLNDQVVGYAIADSTPDPDHEGYHLVQMAISSAAMREILPQNPVAAPDIELEDAMSRWRGGECPYDHEHGPWCDDAEKFLRAGLTGRAE